jgi:hypothetical protein
MLLLVEMDYHLELHEQEIADVEDDSRGDISMTQDQQSLQKEEARGGPSSSRHRSSPGPSARQEKPTTAANSSSSRQQNAISAWKHILNMPSSSHRLSNADRRDTTSAAPGKRLGVSAGDTVKDGNIFANNLIPDLERPSWQICARRTHARLGNQSAREARAGRPTW